MSMKCNNCGSSDIIEIEEETVQIFVNGIMKTMKKIPFINAIRELAREMKIDGGFNVFLGPFKIAHNDTPDYIENNMKIFIKGV